MTQNRTGHLGRNPLKKKAVEEKPTAAIPNPVRHASSSDRNFFLVDLPAGVFLLTLKTALLVKSVFFDSDKKIPPSKL